MRQTARTFLLIAFTVLILLLMHFLPQLYFGDIKLRNVSILSELSESPRDAEVTDVIPKPEPPKQMKAKNNNGLLVDFKEEWPEGVQPVEDYSEGAPGGMEHFFTLLSQLADTTYTLDRPVRIAYFGDSFIEGDILTSDLREALQQRYGGCGVGWVDAGNVICTMKRTVGVKFSGTEEHTVMKKSNGYDVEKAGIAERYYIASPGARISFTGKSDHYKHCGSWDISRLYLRAPGGGKVSVDTDGGVSDLTLNASGDVQMVEKRGKTSSVSFTMSNSSTLFGVGLESDRGVIIDNFSMRGSSGMTLANLPESTLKQFAKIRQYDLIVFQFGQNAVSAKGSNAHYKAYLDNMEKAMNKFKTCFPEASILFVSCGDRGQRTAAGITTINTLENMVALQQQAAANAKVGFYNLFLAMGGKNSMAKLVEQKMANKDYIHINFDGGAHVAQFIYKSFVAGEKNYTRKRKLEEE